MKYNIIGIDPSLISTAVVINGKMFNYCRESDAANKSGLSKWFKMCEQLMTLRYISYRKFEEYSEGELIKLKDYDKVSDMIINDIKLNIDINKETIIGIEGYSYSSDAGAIIDLVTFSTLLRKKLFDHVSENITIFSPSTLKLESCKMTYPVKDIGKKKPKLEWRNYEGMAGGKFTKREMYLSITDNSILNDDWHKHLINTKSEMFEGKSIKKPYEDMNDAYLLYNILKNKNL